MSALRKKLAVLIPGGNLNVRKGLVNASLSRVSHLIAVADYDVEAFYLLQEVWPLTIGSLLRLRPETRVIDGIKIRILKRIEFQTGLRFVRVFLRKYNSFTHRGLYDMDGYRRFARFFKDYDAISVHFNDGAFIASEVKRRYGVPFFVTWHGSDIHSLPFCIERFRTPTIAAIEEAECNFFVSRALLEISDELTRKGRKEVLYNGADSSFYRYDEDIRKQLRERFGLRDEKVVTFAGAIREIKNVMLLPDIFSRVKELYAGSVKFWIIGNGVQEKEVAQKAENLGVDIKFWGAQPLNEMPGFFNCTDVLVLPSKNEGLPLVTLEAIHCGANAVASRVGGLPESIGEDFCITVDDDFVESFANKTVSLLGARKEQKVLPEFDWNRTAIKENTFYQELFNRN